MPQTVLSTMNAEILGIDCKPVTNLSMVRQRINSGHKCKDVSLLPLCLSTSTGIARLTPATGCKFGNKFLNEEQKQARLNIFFYK